MIQVSESWVRPFNIGVIVFMLIMVIAGYRKGVIKQLVELLGTLFSAWVSYWGSSVLSEYFQLAPKAFTPLQGTIFGDAVYQYFNEMVWFLLLFLICRVALGFICHAATSARNMPFISTAGGIIRRGPWIIKRPACGLYYCHLYCRCPSSKTGRLSPKVR